MTSKFRPLGPAAALLGLLALATPAHAVKFRVLGWSASDVNLQFEADQKATELAIYTENLSPFYEYKAGGPLVLYKMVEHEGKPRKQPSCTVVIPPEARQGIIILVPGDDAKAASRKVQPNHLGLVSEAPVIYDYLWLDDSPAARPSGTLEFRNFTRRPIALQIEQKQILLAPQAREQVPLVKGAKRMAFKAATQVGGAWRIFASNPLPTRNPDRMLVILRDRPARNPAGPAAGEPDIQMLSLYDWPPPPPADSARPVAAR